MCLEPDNFYIKLIFLLTMKKQPVQLREFLTDEHVKVSVCHPDYVLLQCSIILECKTVVVDSSLLVFLIVNR